MFKELSIPKIYHAYSGAWKHDTKNHWKECDECKRKGQEAVHDFGEWIIVAAAEQSIATAAERERECVVCGYKETEKILMKIQISRIRTNRTM